MKVDDYGCFWADTRLLKANLFALKLDKIREADMLRWMAECQKAGLIVLYEVNQKKYLQIVDFRQRLDKAKAKFPLPNNIDPVEVVNESVPEVEVEVEKEVEEKGTRAHAKKSDWNTKPGAESLDLVLPPLKANAVIELFAFSKNTKVDISQVYGLWNVFKHQNFNSEKFYSSVNQVFSHFMNWCKMQDVRSLPANGNTSPGISARESKAREILNS